MNNIDFYIMWLEQYLKRLEDFGLLKLWYTKWIIREIRRKIFEDVMYRVYIDLYDIDIGSEYLEEYKQIIDEVTKELTDFKEDVLRSAIKVSLPIEVEVFWMWWRKKYILKPNWEEYEKEEILI